MHCKLGGGNSNIFGIFTPNLGEDEPILTIIFFKGVGEQPPTTFFFWRGDWLDGMTVGKSLYQMVNLEKKLEKKDIFSHLFILKFKPTNITKLYH